MQSSFKLGRVAGIEIGIHYTWLLAFALITWSLAGGYFPAHYPGWDRLTYWLVGAISALAMFGSVLLHELSHSFVALWRGQEVHSITLFIFGGVSNLKEESEQPQDEFLIAVVGPLSSFALALIFWLALQMLDPRTPQSLIDPTLAQAARSSPLAAVLGYLALINVALGAFNILPGFPLDGGRVLRSIIWAVSGSLRRGTQIASFVGQGFGFLLIFWGVFQMFEGHFLNGLWTSFIGWFLNNAAESTREAQVLRESLRGVRVAELMNPNPPAASPDLSVQDFVLDQVMRQGQRALLVADGGRLLGIVSITDAKKVPQESWSSTPIGEIMTPVPLKTVSPNTAMSRALEMLVDGTLNQAPVVQDGRVVGLLSRADLLRFLQLREELNLRRVPSPRSQVPRF
jgi:Zn-dependent protease